MSEVSSAVQYPRIKEGSPAWMGWRDTITPRSRASRRRWVLFYPLVLVAAAAQAGWGERLGIVAEDDGLGPSVVAVVHEWEEFGRQGGPTERTRDLLLALGFLGALALDAFVDGGAGLFVLIPIICIVAAWVRRGAGHQAIGRHIGSVGIICVAYGSFVPVSALFGAGSHGLGAWVVSIGLLAIGIAVIVAERMERHT